MQITQHFVLNPEAYSVMDENMEKGFEGRTNGGVDLT